MSGAAGMPSAADVQGLLTGLFDRAVTVSEEERPVLRGRDVHVVGSYVDDAGADFLIAKPFTVETFTEALSGILAA